MGYVSYKSAAEMIQGGPGGLDAGFTSADLVNAQDIYGTPAAYDIYTCVYVYICVCVHKNLCIQSHMCTYMHVYTYSYMYSYIHAYIHVHVHLSLQCPYKHFLEISYLDFHQNFLN